MDSNVSYGNALGLLAQRVKEQLPGRYSEIEEGIRTAEKNRALNAINSLSWNDVVEIVMKRNFSISPPTYHTGEEEKRREILRSILAQINNESPREWEPDVPSLPMRSHISEKDGCYKVRFVKWDICAGCINVFKQCLVCLSAEELFSRYDAPNGSLEDITFEI
ncbi:MAG: hypothetical protein M0P97_03655 [Candidatus Moranbacteria bacterium]|jgi:hypothetical protein|nr:hypothetical protein [Candidatus Moranbacteria bacterium]